MSKTQNQGQAQNCSGLFADIEREPFPIAARLVGKPKFYCPFCQSQLVDLRDEDAEGYATWYRVNLDDTRHECAHISDEELKTCKGCDVPGAQYIYAQTRERKVRNGLCRRIENLQLRPALSSVRRVPYDG